MTTAEFWNSEPRVLCSYIKKHELELDEMNYNSWLIGLYTYNALGVVLENMFSKDSKEMYCERPIEELYSSYVKEKEPVSIVEKDDKFKSQKNFWAKLKKGYESNG